MDRMNHTPHDTPIIYVVDSDGALRQSLEPAIRAAGWQPRMDASAEQFLERPRIMGPSCLLLEQDLPGMCGLDLQREVADRIEMPVIFMSSNADVTTSVRAMKARAFEFFVKPCAQTAVLDAIGGALVQSREQLRRAIQMRALQERYEQLSRREREVMSLVICGRMNKQVGGDLGISEITVKAHRGRVMRKMRAHSFAELMNMAQHLSIA